MKSEHPWQNFLHARRLALEWCQKEMGYSYDKLAEVFSMDRGQVQLILMTEVEK